MKSLVTVLFCICVLAGCGESGNEKLAKAAAKTKALAEAKAAADWKVIEAAIREAVKKPAGELTKAELEGVKVLILDNTQLTDVKGLEKLTQLTRLDLGFNKLTSVERLEKLTQLTVLDLHWNKLTNVKGLEKLTQLKLLYLKNNPALTKA